MTPPSFSAVPAIWAFISSFVAWSTLLFITFSNVLTLYFQNLYDLGFVTVVCKCNSDFVLYSYFLSHSASVCVRDIVSHFFYSLHCLEKDLASSRGNEFPLDFVCNSLTPQQCILFTCSDFLYPFRKDSLI